jgi:hypothetical protein
MDLFDFWNVVRRQNVILDWMYVLAGVVFFMMCVSLARRGWQLLCMELWLDVLFCTWVFRAACVAVAVRGFMQHFSVWQVIDGVFAMHRALARIFT